MELVKSLVRLAVVAYAAFAAFDIRMYAINIYGRVIHEFDPWFNFRATQYLADHGMYKFFHWFDYMVWYPLGRPVGTTIYPGMQISAVWIWRTLNKFGIYMSLNDVCCFVPCWFGVAATLILGLLTWECSKSANAAVASALIMAIIPAHIMRSVGGGYDNESVAVTAMVLTFYCHVRSLRSESSWGWGVFTALAYINMVAAWGGYIFVLNMVAIHALALVLLQRYTDGLHHAFSLFYVIGTFGAMQIPVVGWTPLKSLEQLGALAVFLGLQLVFVVEKARAAKGLRAWSKPSIEIYVKAAAAAVAACVVVIMILAPTGYFGPLSSRVRALFVAHTRTGNPLVDSVAEHQPASADAYYQYLHYTCYLAPLGMYFAVKSGSDQSLFLVLYGVVSYFFSSKMSRLIILLGPIASALGGWALANALEWSTAQLTGSAGAAAKDDAAARKKKDDDAEDELTADDAPAAGKKGGKGKKAVKIPKRSNRSQGSSGKPSPFDALYNSEQGQMGRKAGAALVFLMTVVRGREFFAYSHQIAHQMSNPSIMFQAKLGNGQTIMVDDYREAYWWLRDNTAEDARVMAWWDYGYQITGIGNRTTIADGNTWNHEHIATLGRCLTSPEKEAHKLIKHLADYVLIWTGGGGDDLAKSPHMARIGTSVYKDICPGDPTCRHYGFQSSKRDPTPSMAASLLYKLDSNTVDSNKFEEVFQSKYYKVRIFKVKDVSQKSKAWVADPANRKCDAEGSWYCEGQYPPAFQKKMGKAGRKDFAQLENFNKKKSKEEIEYNDEYHKKMGGD